VSLPRAYEDQLVERAKSDADAFGELYEAYFGQIYRFVYSRMRDQDAAEDVTSEVFFKALRAVGRYKPSGHPFSAWLYQISVNAIADHYRARKPASNIDDAIGVAQDEVTGMDRHAADGDWHVDRARDRAVAPQLARIAAGLETSTADAARWAATECVVEPNPAWTGPTQDRYARFLELGET